MHDLGWPKSFVWIVSWQLTEKPERAFWPTCYLLLSLVKYWTSLEAQMVKNLPTTQVQSLGWEELLEKEMATHSSIPAWKIPWMEEPGRLQFMGLQRVGHDWATSLQGSNPWHRLSPKCSFFFLSTPCSLWNLSSLSWDWTWAMAVKAWNPTH